MFYEDELEYLLILGLLVCPSAHMPEEPSFEPNQQFSLTGTPYGRNCSCEGSRDRVYNLPEYSMNE